MGVMTSYRSPYSILARSHLSRTLLMSWPLIGRLTYSLDFLSIRSIYYVAEAGVGPANVRRHSVCTLSHYAAYPFSDLSPSVHAPAGVTHVGPADDLPQKSNLFIHYIKTKLFFHDARASENVIHSPYHTLHVRQCRFRHFLHVQIRLHAIQIIGRDDKVVVRRIKITGREKEITIDISAFRRRNRLSAGLCDGRCPCIRHRQEKFKTLIHGHFRERA